MRIFPGLEVSPLRELAWRIYQICTCRSGGPLFHEVDEVMELLKVSGAVLSPEFTPPGDRGEARGASAPTSPEDVRASGVPCEETAGQSYPAAAHLEPPYLCEHGDIDGFCQQCVRKAITASA